MIDVREVEIIPVDPARLRTVIGARRYGSLHARGDDFRVWMGGTRIWNINSTATGGGVEEMLQVLVGYGLELGLGPRQSDSYKRAWSRASGSP